MKYISFYRFTKNRGRDLFFFIFALSLYIPGIFDVRAGDLLWSWKPQAGYVDASPAVGDLDGDGVQDLVLAATSGRVAAIDANGREKWAFDARETISNPPTLAGQPPRVYVMTNPGKIICLSAETGARIWDFKMPADFPWGMTALAAADVNGDGRVELIAADRGGHLVCLADDGDVLWQTTHKSGFNTAPAVADLDGDGQPEILLGAAAMPLVCFSNKGKELWHARGGAPAASSPVVYDVNGDGVAEILLGEGDGLSAYDAGGVRKWHYAMKGQVHDAIAVGDVDKDGRLDIVIVDLRGKVACLSGAGELKWSADVRERSRRSPAIADIDGDMKPEVIVGNYSDALYVFDGQGNLKEQRPLHGGMNASPTIVDFRGDGRLSVVCATTSDVVALNWAPEQGGALPHVQWAEYRVNSARTGAPVKEKEMKRTHISDIDYGPLHVGVNAFCVVVDNPKRRRLTLEMEIRKNNGAPVTSTLSSSDSVFSCRMPYSISGQSAVNISFAVDLKEGKKRLSQRRQEFYLVPFARDAADLRESIARLEENAARLANRRAIEEQTTLLTLKVQQLEERARAAGTMSPLARAELRTGFEEALARATRLETMTRAALDAGNALAVYAANPWAPFGGADEIAEGRTNPAALAVEAFAGETESAAVNLANFSGRAVVVRVEPQDLLARDSTTVSFRQALQFHEVLDVPTTRSISPQTPCQSLARRAPWCCRPGACVSSG